MTESYYLWRNDITNRKSPTSISDTLTGDIYVATAVISGVTTNSGEHMAQWEAYLDLRNRVLGISEADGDRLLPVSTTTQRDLLTGIMKGTSILNDTTEMIEKYDGTNWASSAGSSSMSAFAYGHMYENNSTGSAMETTNKTWITATTGVVDANGIVTVVNDDTNGDYFLVGTDGGGDYVIHVDTTQTNAGNNDTILTVQIDGVDTIMVRDEIDTSSTKPTALDANGILSLVATNKVRLHMVSSTPADVVKAYYTHFYIHRLS